MLKSLFIQVLMSKLFKGIIVAAIKAKVLRRHRSQREIIKTKRNHFIASFQLETLHDSNIGKYTQHLGIIIAS